MKTISSYLTSLVIPFFMLSGIAGNYAVAQEKAKMPVPKAEIKVLLDNEKVRVTENRWVPGAETESIARSNRVVRALKGGTVQRIHPDGKKETVAWKTGEVRFNEKADPYIVKNIGKTEVVLYIVNLK